MALGPEYDVMFRLQVLEGAAGVRPGSWWQKGRRGLKAAEDVFTGTSIDPSWLQSGNSGLASYLLRTAHNAVREFKLTHIGGEDILHNALMGLKLDGSPGAKLPAYSAGEALSDAIKAGKETPKTAAKMIAQFLARKVQNETKKLRRMERIPEGPEGEEVELPGKTSPEDPAAFFRWFAHLVFGDMSHPLGKKIRDFMRKTWEGTAQEEPMDIWLDMIESGRRPSTKEVAEQAGMAAGTFSSRHLKPAWRRFAKEIWSSPLISAIKDQAAKEGILWIPDKPDLDALVDQKGRPILRPRRASHKEMAARIASYWMLFQ